jgi:hypothetical protein
MINALESLNLTQESQSNVWRRVGRGARALAQLKMLTSMSNCQESSPRAGQHKYIHVTLRIELLYTGQGHQTRLASVARMHATCPSVFESQRSKSSSTDTSIASCPCVCCPNRHVCRLKVRASVRPMLTRRGLVRSKCRFSAT